MRRGDLIVYPMRKHSELWVNVAEVEAILSDEADPRGPYLFVKLLKQKGMDVKDEFRRIRQNNFKLCTVIHRDLSL